MTTTPAPIPPGEILLHEFMEPLKLSQNQLARDIDVPVSRVSAIVKGGENNNRRHRPEIGAYFGTTPELWLNLQTSYDLRQARRTIWPKVKARIRSRV